EVTSKLEGVFNTVKGVKDISSISEKGKASISIDFKKGTNLDAVRFELANLIRQSYPEFPESVSYPYISLNSVNENNTPILSYSINANESPYYIKKYTENQILPKLASLKGVNQVNVYGAAPFEWVIEYDSNKLIQLNLTINDIEVAINDYLNDLELGSGTLSSKQNEATHEISIVLTHNMEDEVNWNKIPIKKVNHRIVYLEN